MNATSRATYAQSPGDPTSAMFRAIAEQWPGAVFVLNREGAIRWLNEPAHAWVTGDPQAVIGTPLVNLDLPWIASAGDVAAAVGGAARRYSGRNVIDRRGCERFCSARLMPFALAGTPCGALLFVEDLSAGEESTIVQPLAVSDTQRALGLAAAQVGSWHRDLLTGEAAVDPVWCDALRLDPCAGSEHLARWEKYIHPDDVAEYRAKSAELASARSSAFEVEYRILTNDSRWLWLLQRGRVSQIGENGEALRAEGICLEIDDRKRAEVALQENESRLATALWGARAAFWQWQITGDVAVRSPLWYAMTGYTRQEWDSVASPWAARVHPDDMEATKAAIQAHLSGRTQSLELEYRIRTASGEYKWMQDRGRISEWDFDGNPTIGIGVSLDIDQQKRAELELRSSETRLETAIWGAKIGLWEMDFRTDVTVWHNDWCSEMDLIPCDGSDHVARWDANIHPDDVTAAATRFAEHVEGKYDHYAAEYRIRTMAGEWRWIFERGRVVERAPDGTALRMAGITMDIEDRRAAESDARELQLRLEAALAQAKGAVWEQNLVDGTVYSHDMFRKLLGVDTLPSNPAQRRELWLERMHPDDHENLFRTERRVASGEIDEFESEYRLKNAQGEWRWILDRGRVTSRRPDGRPAHIAGFLIDATERVEMQAALRESEIRYRLVSELTPGYVFQYRFDDYGVPRMMWASRGFREVFGCEYDELERHGGGNAFVLEEDLPSLEQHRDKLRNGETAAVGLRLNDLSGQLHYLHMQARPVLDPATGAVVGAMGVANDVTAQRSAEGARADADAMLRDVTRHAPDWLMLLDTNLRMRFVNRGWRDYTPEDLIGRTFLDYIPEVNRARVEQSYRTVLATGQAAEIEVVHPSDDGTALHLTYRVHPVVVDGKIASIAVAVTDQSRRRLAEARTRETESVLRTIADVTSDWLMMLDRDMKCVFINRGMGGLAPTELVGASIDKLGPPIAQPGFATLVEDVMWTGEPRTVEQDFQDPDVHSVRSFEVRLWPVRDRSEVTGVVIAASEVSERRRQEVALRMQARILETMREGVVLVDTDAIIRLTNPAFDELFGFNAGAAIGQSIESVAQRVNGSPGRLTKEEAGRLKEGEAIVIEFDCTRRDGKRFIASCVVTPVTIGGETHRLAVVNDVTERKHLEREILEIANREQQRMGSDLHDGLGQDLTGIALLLRGVAGQLRKEKSEARGDVEEVIGLVNSAIESTRTLARGLSPVTGERGGLVAALQALATRIQDRHGVTVELSAANEAVSALDESASNHLFRIAQEAVLNAVRHGRPTRVRIALSRDRDRLRLVVDDNGRGFGANAQASSGLGLKIMRYRAQMLSGDLLVQGDADGGVRVICQCPAVQGRIGPNWEAKRP